MSVWLRPFYFPPPLSVKAAAKKPAKVPTAMGARITGRAAPVAVKSAAAAETKRVAAKAREGEVKVPEPTPPRAAQKGKIGEILAAAPNCTALQGQRSPIESR